MRRLESVLRRSFLGPCAIARGSRILIAASGGADSTALLIGASRLASELGLVVHAAHLHHGLRGADADRDQKFVAALCARLDVPMIATRWDTRRRMARRGLSGEAGLRTLRREFLIAAAARIGAAAIATAHTADDQLETLLLRLLRGSGLPGLGGMSPRRGRWIKPLLGATRHEIEGELRRAHESWRDDRSNLDPEFARNRIRHSVVPALVRALAPASDPKRARAALARRVAETAREARESRRALEAWVTPAIESAMSLRNGGLDLHAGRLLAFPRAARRTLLRLAWRRLAPKGQGLTHAHLDALDRLACLPRSGVRVRLPGGWNALGRKGGARIERAQLDGPRTPVRLTVPGQAQWADCTLEGRWTSGAGALRRMSRKAPDEEYFAADGLEGELELRAARADESFVPFGRRTATRLGAFLKRQRIPRDQRSGWEVLADAGGILWVVGVRRSARAPVRAGTRRVLRVHAERS